MSACDEEESSCYSSSDDSCVSEDESHEGDESHAKELCAFIDTRFVLKIFYVCVLVFSEF
jgi:hypothetical protein